MRVSKLTDLKIGGTSVLTFARSSAALLNPGDAMFFDPVFRNP